YRYSEPNQKIGARTCGDKNRHYLQIFFFQAEDGIRDYKVTGVQTCALPIFRITVRQEIHRRSFCLELHVASIGMLRYVRDLALQIGRASCRERVYIIVVVASFAEKRRHDE